MKAIKITTANRQMLASRYDVDVEDFDSVLPIDYYFITDFGNEETFEVITPALFNAAFIVVSNLLNGFQEVRAV